MNGVQAAVERLVNAVAMAADDGRDVLLLLPGGSAATIIAPLFERLAAYQQHVIISLTDERYGETGHKDANWRVVDKQRAVLPQAAFVPVLHGKGAVATIADWNKNLQQWATDPNVDVMLLTGIGDDGHTLGIKPHSPACTSDAFACCYEWDDFTRITITPKVVKSATLTVLYANGPQKQSVIDRLTHQDNDAKEFPAEYIKQSIEYEVIYDSGAKGGV